MDMNVFVRLTNGTASLIFFALMGFLVFLCFRTRSRGLILVAAALALIKVKFLNWIVAAVLNAYNIVQWDPALDVRGEKLFLRLEIAIITSGIEVVLCYMGLMSTRCVSHLQRVATG